MRPLAVLAPAVVLLALALDLWGERVVADASVRLLATTVLVNVLVAVSLNVINGMAGQLSIGHAGFVGVGAYAAAVVASHVHAALGGGAATLLRSFVVMPCALAAAMAIAAGFGLAVGLPSLRLRGDYLAVVTLGFAEIVRLGVASAKATGDSLLSRLGGANGYAGLGDPGQGVPLYAGPFWIVLVVAAFCFVAWRLKFSRWGRALRALREDEIAAASVGIDPTRYKVGAFVIAAIGAGAAGALLALRRDGAPTVQPDNFGFAASFDDVAMVVLGGSGSVTGSAIGAVIVTLSIKLIELVPAGSLVDPSALRMIAYAALLVVVMIARPTGILGERELGRGGA